MVKREPLSDIICVIMHTHVLIQLKFLFIPILSQIALLRGSNFCHVRKTTILIISLQIKLIFRFTIF